MERGDDGFAAYVAARQQRLVRTAVLLGCSVADAEDAVQSVLERIWPRWRRVQRMSHPDAYVYRSLVNQVRRQGKAASRLLTAAESPDTKVEDPTIGHGRALAVRQALAGLSADHRAVIVLRYYADLSEADTAAALKVAPGTVKSRTSRAMNLLAAHPALADDEPETRGRTDGRGR